MKDGRINTAAQKCTADVLFTEWGEKIIYADNGCISFTVLADRAMDIYSLRHRGTSVAFLSKNGLRGYKQEFESSFEGGLLYTCGLDTVGGRKLPVHGKIHRIPAHITGVISDGEGISITGSVLQSGLFGENLVLYRTVKTKYGSGILTVENTLANEGYCDAEYCLLFHVNFGYPMLDAGVKILADVTHTAPRTEAAARGIKECFDMTLPVVGGEEQVFFHKVKNGKVSVLNDRLKKRATVEYDSEQMPHFIEWKSMVAGDYALGIEPSTTTLDGNFERKILKAGESVSFPLAISVEDCK